MADIRITDLNFRYPGTRDFNLRLPELHIESGQCVAVVGPSGSGKTTLLALTAGILLPQSGEIHIGDACISHLGESRRRNFRIHQIGQVFQAFELLEYLDVLQNVLLSGIIDPAAVINRQIKDRATQLLASVGLADKAQARPAELSHGERQRVAVCRAMLNEPQLLLADEPTGNLDQDNKQNVVDLLLEQARSNNSTLLMVTHDRSLLGAFERVIDFEELMGTPT